MGQLYDRELHRQRGNGKSRMWKRERERKLETETATEHSEVRGIEIERLQEQMNHCSYGFEKCMRKHTHTYTQTGTRHHQSHM